MIVKARAGQGGPALARYLDGGKNENAELLALRNLDAPSLNAAIYDMDGLARGSACRNHALHVQLRAAPGERLTPDQWREACDRYAEAFGMEDHQAAIILHHQQDGTTHAHLVFNRVHPETLKAADLWRNYPKHKELARQMERDWGLQPVPDRKREQARDYSQAGQQETEQARRMGQNVHDIREHVRQLWENSQTGQEFAGALEAEGYQLAKGDKRDYVVLDPTGSPYSLGSRTTGAKAREVREKLGDLDPAKVPDIAEGRRLLQERQQERQHQRERQGKGGRHAIIYSMAQAQERPTVGLWLATRGREAQTPAPAPPKAAPSVLKGLGGILAAMATPPTAKPAPAPQPARPLVDAEPQPEKKDPKQALLDSLHRQREERAEAKKQRKGRGLSPVSQLFDALHKKSDGPG